jgi:hypothetical protein
LIWILLLSIGCSEREPEQPTHSIAPLTSESGQIELGVSGNETLNGCRIAHEGFDAFSLGGMNFEHIHSLQVDVRNGYTPRSGELIASTAPVGSFVLARPSRASPWGVRYRLELATAGPHYVDFRIEAEFTDASEFTDQTAILFFANYMNFPGDVDFHFFGVDGPNQSPRWLKTIPPADGSKDTNVPREGAAMLAYDPADTLLDLDLNDHPSFRFTEPTLLGRFDNGKSFQLLLDPRNGDDVRLSLMRRIPVVPGIPAWDFGWVLTDLKNGDVRELKGRIVFKNDVGALSDALAELAAWRDGF